MDAQTAYAQASQWINQERPGLAETVAPGRERTKRLFGESILGYARLPEPPAAFRSSPAMRVHLAPRVPCGPTPAALARLLTRSPNSL